MSGIGRHLASSLTADVFDWDDRHVIKLYRHSPATATREAAHTRAVRALGVPAPVVADVVTIQGRVGIIFERVDGPTMLEALAGGVDRVSELARSLATLHAGLHTLVAAGLPAQRERLRGKIERASDLSVDTREAILAALDSLPDGAAVCHGDFHPGNIVLTAGGPVIIDWPDASRGHPLADVARTLLLLEHALVRTHTLPVARDVFAAMRAAFSAAYLEHYTRLRSMDRAQLEAWKIQVAAARLAEGRSAAEHHLLLALIDRWRATA